MYKHTAGKSYTEFIINRVGFIKILKKATDKGCFIVCFHFGEAKAIKYKDSIYLRTKAIYYSADFPAPSARPLAGLRAAPVRICDLSFVFIHRINYPAAK